MSLLQQTSRLSTVLSSRLFSSSTVEQFPKLKSHSGAKKRWKALGSGNIFKRAKAGHQHLNVTKNQDRINRLGQTAYSNHTQTAKLKKALPYS